MCGVYQKGIYLRFEKPVDPESTKNVHNYTVQRWNYRRSSKYGSPHLKLDGTPGQEYAGISEVLIHPDGKAVFLVIPDMCVVMQVDAAYRIKDIEGNAMNDHVYLTVHQH